MKRVLALVLSVILLLGCSTVAVSAAGSDEDAFSPAALVVTLTRLGHPQNITMPLSGYDIEPLYLMNPGDALAMYYVQFKDEVSDKTVNEAVAALKSNPVFIKEVTPYYSGMTLPVERSREFPFNPPKSSTQPVTDVGHYMIPDQSKLSAALIEKLSEPGVEQVDVCIFLKSCIRSEAEVERIISEKYTWTTQQEHLMYWRKEVSERIAAYVQQFIDEHGELLDAVIWRCDGVEMIEATVSRENIAALAALHTVSDLDLFMDYICEPDIEPYPSLIAKAANERYFDPRHTITAEDIHLFDSYTFRGGTAYAVYFSVKGLEYYAVMIEEHIGDWLLVSSHPEPFLFVDDHLYSFKEAYDAGLMTDEMLAELAGSSFRGNCRYPILIPYIKGDADGDGECNIIDATVIQRHDADIATVAFYKPLGDVDDDGETNVIDATLIQRSEVGLYTIS